MALPMRSILLLIFTTVVTAQIFCPQIVLSTTAYECALAASANSCPVKTDAGFSYWPAAATDGTATNTGCCASTATPHSTGADIACCPCAAICTGSLPAMCDWSTTNGVLAIVQTTPTPTTATVPTGDVQTPYHGPETAMSTVTESSVSEESSASESVIGTPITTKSFASPVPTFSESSSTTSITVSESSLGSTKSSAAATVSTNAGGVLRPMRFGIDIGGLMQGLGWTAGRRIPTL